MPAFILWAGTLLQLAGVPVRKYMHLSNYKWQRKSYVESMSKFEFDLLHMLAKKKYEPESVKYQIE